MASGGEMVGKKKTRMLEKEIHTEDIRHLKHYNETHTPNPFPICTLSNSTAFVWPEDAQRILSTKKGLRAHIHTTRGYT